MAKQTVQPRKGKRGPPATGKGTPIQVRLQPPQLEDLDRWIAAQDDPKPTRPQAIRVILDSAIARPRSHDQKVADAKSTIAKNQPKGRPSPERGMDTLRRGLAENDLRTLKGEKSKRTPGASNRK
ncbi:MAG: hypothetical protein K2Y29_11415 [Beijerinckiaceae bacterium]|nr:hypothetical protein [Beijerinckiaceae bacterium]